MRDGLTAAGSELIIGGPHSDVNPMVVIGGNEIGLGVIPMGRQTRGFVDERGRLNQSAAAACSRVTFMAAGLPLSLKGQP